MIYFVKIRINTTGYKIDFEKKIYRLMISKLNLR